MLNALPSVTGLLYKKGKFSAIEEQQLSDAIQAYKEVGPFIPSNRDTVDSIISRKIRSTTQVSQILCLQEMERRRITHSGLLSVRTQLLVRHFL